MAHIPEERQAAALRRVAEVAERRERTIAALDRELEEAAVEAARVGAARARIKDLARVSPRTLYGWLAAAGVEIRRRGRS